MSTLREALRERVGTLTPVEVTGVLPVTVWLHQVSVATMDKVRSASQRFGANAEEVEFDVERFNNLLLAESLREGPEPDANQPYKATDADLDALRADILPGERQELLSWINAMLGYKNEKTPLLPTSRAGGSSLSGAFTAAEGGSPQS